MSDEDKKLEAIAERWVNMIFMQIESKKQQKKDNNSVNNFENDEENYLPSKQ